ncbi:MAG: helix-turn-helix transcriptional regulator [Paracoccaceae bacterium]
MAMQFFTITQGRRARFHHLLAPVPALVRVRAGIKTVLGQGAPVDVTAGRFCLMPEAVPLTVENRPAPGRPYLAEALAIPRPVLERAYARLPGLNRPDEAGAVACDLPAAAEELFQCFAPGGAAARWPEPVAGLRLEELALWAAEAGAVLARAAPERQGDRLRGLIGAEPGADWTAATAARALAMSEATLRRRLAAEGSGFAEILREMRLCHGLALLQTTALPVGRIALEAGYASASQFAQRFRERFGLLPREIREAEATADRNAA